MTTKKLILKGISPSEDKKLLIHSSNKNSEGVFETYNGKKIGSMTDEEKKNTN